FSWSLALLQWTFLKLVLAISAARCFSPRPPPSTPGVCLFYGELCEPQAQERDDRGLLGAHSCDVPSQIGLCLVRQRPQQRTIEIAFENRWMDIAFAADGSSIAEMFGNPLDRTNNRRFGGNFGVQHGQFLQHHSGEMRAGPGAKILCSDVLAADLAQVRVD